MINVSINNSDNMNKKENIIQLKSFDFSMEIIKFYKHYLDSNEYILSKQLVRCGTSIGANIEEASAAQTKKDFIAKMSISSKEARETRYWLKLFSRSGIIKYNYTSLLKKIEDIINILTAIVKTSQQNTTNKI